jgi:restriction endonuclease S subunit
MIVYSIIQKSQLEGGLRLDAEYYQPEYLNLISKIKSQKSKLLGEIGEIVYGTTPAGGVFEEQGIPFIRSQNFSLLNISDDFVFCSENFHRQNKKSKVEPGDILFAAVGATIGQLAIIQDEIKEANINQNIAAIKIKDKKFNSYFVGLFFASYFGQLQIERLVTGNAQFYLNTEQIKNFIVPVLEKKSQDRIAEIFQKAQKELENSKSLYSQAENLLLEELGLKDFEVEDDLSYIVNLSEIKSARRADAEYFQPKYDKLVKRIKKFGAAPLLDLAQNVAARFNPKSQQTKLFQYVELSNITSSVGTIDGFSEVAGDEAPSRAKRVLKTNDVILSSVEGSLEKVALVGKEQEGYLASNGFFQFRSKDILPEVLLVLAKSFVLQMQFEKQTAGTILTAVPKEAVKNIVVPQINKSTQQKIADLVQKSHQARSKAKRLLEQAKNKVEDLIEE